VFGEVHDQHIEKATYLGREMLPVRIERIDREVYATRTVCLELTASLLIFLVCKHGRSKRAVGTKGAAMIMGSGNDWRVTKAGGKAGLCRHSCKAFDSSVQPTFGSDDSLFVVRLLSELSINSAAAARISSERAGSLTARARMMAPTISAIVTIALRRPELWNVLA
jgi:hypothetical protein